MARLVLVLGRSGSGKSASMRNFAPGDVAIINVLGKELPFKSEHKTFVSDDYAKIKQALTSAPKDVIVIDDAGYLMTNEFMNRCYEKGYEKFTEMARNFYELLRFVKFSLPDNKIVYFFMHIDTDAEGYERPMTAGKMLDEKYNIAGVVTIALKSEKHDNKYVFKTTGNNQEITKTPMGMFADEEIDNDLAAVTQAIKKYYNITEATK